MKFNVKKICFYITMSDNLRAAPPINGNSIEIFNWRGQFKKFFTENWLGSLKFLLFHVNTGFNWDR